MNLNTDNSTAISVEGSSIVMWEGFVKLVRGGEVIASLPAEFDFKDVPAEYHAWIFQCLRGYTLHMPSRKRVVREEEPIVKTPWWKRWFYATP